MKLRNNEADGLMGQLLLYSSIDAATNDGATPLVSIQYYERKKKRLYPFFFPDVCVRGWQRFGVLLSAGSRRQQECGRSTEQNAAALCREK